LRRIPASIPQADADDGADPDPGGEFTGGRSHRSADADTQHRPGSDQSACISSFVS
jgi:hypothetical protein